MTHLIVIVGLAMGGIILVALVRLLVPAKAPTPSADTNWEQRSGSELPSLDGFSAPQSLGDIPVGVGAEPIDGGR